MFEGLIVISRKSLWMEVSQDVKRMPGGWSDGGQIFLQVIGDD
jgi:hypothetical protein